MADEEIFKSESFPNKTITVGFGEWEGQDGGEADPESISIELDEKKNEGKTEFLFGSDCWLGVVASSSEYMVRPSHGRVEDKGASVVTIEDEKVVFAETDTANTSKLIKSISAKSFDGKGKVGVLSIDEDSGNTINNSKGELLGILTVDYTSDYFSHKLHGVEMPEGYDEEEDPGLEVVVVAKISETTQAELTVVFKASIDDAEEKDTGDGGESIEIFVDDKSFWNFESLDFDADEGPTIKSRWAWGESADFRVILSDWENSYQVFVSFGVILKEEGIDKYYKTETLTFSHTKEEELSSLPIETRPETEWLYGTDGGTPTFDGKTITLTNEALGFLKVRYHTKAERWRLTIDGPPIDSDGEEYDVITVNVVAVQEANEISASTTVEFGEVDETTSDKSVTVSLDEKKNEEVYGEGTTSFPYNKKAYLMVLGPAPYNVYWNIESAYIKMEASSIMYEVEEEIQVANTDEAALSNNPEEGSVSWSWIGKAPSTSVTFSGKEITFSEKVLAGVLSVKYSTEGQRWSVKLPEDPFPDNDEPQTDVFIVFIPTEYPDIEGSISVTFGEEESDEIYEVVIVDNCNGEPVPGAYVSGGITGVCDSVTANDDGVVYTGRISPGKHAVGVITATNYIPSDKDPLDNEEIQVTVDEEEQV